MKITYLAGILIVMGGAFLVWKSSFRNAYESAAYSQVEAEGKFEIRDYANLQLATTPTDM